MAKTFEPMLAAKIQDADLRYPLLASPKLDGVRALIMNGQVMSRNLKPIPNLYTQRLFSLSILEGLDGELIVGPATAPNTFRRTSSGVMSVEGEPDVTFYVFDRWDVPATPFHVRTVMAENVALLNRVKYVRHHRVSCPEAVLELEHSWLECGYEGVMLRDPAGPYKHGRSTAKEGWLMKLKRFQDSEALVLGTVEQVTNTNAATRDALGRTKRSSHAAGKVAAGILGALQVRDLVTGVEFDIGSGFDAATRMTLWDNRRSILGKVVKYRFFPSGSKAKPRFPTFVGFRDTMDF